MAKSRGRKFAELIAPTNGVFAAASLPTIALSKLASSTFSVNSESASLGGNVVLDSNDITEHTSALYFTNARADARADARITAASLLPLAGGTMTGNLTLGDNVNVYFGASTDLRIYHDGTNSHIINSTGELRFTGSNFAFKSDSAKLYFGLSDDLQIYHDGSNSYIKEIGTGSLKIGASDLFLQSSDFAETMLNATPNGVVTLYYDNSAKLATTSTGVQTTGTLNVNGAYSFPTSDGTNGQVLQTDGSGNLTFVTGGGGAGDITAVVAGTNLTGGATSGSATVNLATNLSGLGTISSGKITTSGSGTATSPVLGIAATNAQTFIYGSNVFAASMTAGQFVGHFFGKAGSTKNAGGLGYYWAASGSDTNFVSIGHWGADHLLRLYGNGTLNIHSGGLQIGGTTVIDSSREGSFATRAQFGGVDSVGNVSPPTNNAIVSGYGIVGNRPTIYITNSGDVQIGNGSTHNNNPGLTVSTSAVNLGSSRALQMNGTAVIDSSRNITVPNVYISDANTRLTDGSGNSVRIQTDSGYVEVGPQNTTYTHFQTDRPNFYFDKPIHADGQIYNYDGGATSQPYWHAGNDGSGSGLDADLLDGVQATGYGRFYNNAVITATTTSALITTLTNNYGAFNNNYVSVKVQWSYAGSGDLVTGHSTIGTIELAGCLIEAWGGTYKHIRITRPTTGTGGSTICVYNDQGSGYSPGWREIWTSETDGSGSGLDADLLDGYNSAENGASTIHRLASNGYSQLQNWTNVASAGLYSTTVNGAHFYPNTAGSYGTWRIDGSRGGYSGIYLSSSNGVITGMYDGSGNGGAWSSASSWHFYYHRSNDCFAISGSGTSSSYSAYVHGALYATGNITAYSDRRIKENIVPIDNALEKVNKLAGVYYNRIDDEKKSREIGFIAQDVNEVTPELVTYAEDVDQYGVKYQNATALLVEAVKELTQQVNDLKAEIKELKNA